MTMFEEGKDFHILEEIAPVTADAAVHAVVGNVIDLQGYNSCTFVLLMGAIAGGGSATYKVYEDDAVGMGTEVECTAALHTIASDPVAIADTSDHLTFKTSYIGMKRYVRIKLTTVGAFAKDYAAVAILGHMRHSD